MSETETNGATTKIKVLRPTEPVDTTQEHPIDQTQAQAMPESPPSEQPEPVPRPKYIGRAVLLIILVLGIGNLWQVLSTWREPTRYQTKPVAVPESAPSPPAASPAPAPQIDINQSIVRRNVALSNALNESNTQSAAVICSRTEYLLREAQQALETEGTPIEVTLLRKLDYIRSQMRGTLLQTSQLSGSPEQSGTARQLVIDTQAILSAIQLEYTNVPVPMCRNALATLLESIDNVYGLSVQARQVTSEQQLREAGIEMRQFQQVEPNPTPPEPPIPLPTAPSPSPSATPYINPVP